MPDRHNKPKTMPKSAVVKQTDLKRTNFPWLDQPLDRRTFFSLSLRQALAVSLAMGLPPLVAGCGGGGGGGDNKPSPYLNTPTPPRTEPTGALKDQINLYSQSVETLAQQFIGTSESLEGVVLVKGGKSRAQGRAEISNPYQIAAYSVAHYIALSRMYERLCQGVIALDNSAHLSRKVTTNFTLGGNASTENPQWNAAMYLKLLRLMRLCQIHLQYFQTIGAKTFADSITNLTDDTQRQLGYALYSEAFNRWITKVYAMGQKQPDAGVLLDVRADLKVSDISVQLARVPSIVDHLVLVPGYRPSSSRAIRPGRADGPDKKEESLGAKVGEKAEESFFGALLKPFEVTKADFFQQITVFVEQREDYFAAGIHYVEEATIELERAPYLKRVLDGFKEGLYHLAIDQVAKAAFGKMYGHLGEVAADCASSIVGGAEATEEIAGALAITEEGVGAALVTGPIGAAVAAGAALVVGGLAAKELIKCIKDASEEIEKQAEGAEEAGQEEAEAVEAPFTDRPAETVPDQPECDQLARRNLKRYDVAPPAGSQRNLGSMDVQTARNLLDGTTAAGEPRTYDSVDQAVRELLADYASQYPDFLHPQVNGSDLSVLASDFPALIRRSPGATSANIPAISNADLLCTAVGYIPMRNQQSVDTGNITLPGLMPITELGTGVDIHAS